MEGFPRIEEGFSRSGDGFPLSEEGGGSAMHCLVSQFHDHYEHVEVIADSYKGIAEPPLSSCRDRGGLHLKSDGPCGKPLGGSISAE